jgi:ribonuclease P protein component
MLAKQNRIVHNKDIKSTINSKFRIKTKYFTVISKKNFEPSTFKLLVIISKKISKRANIRNKIRRRTQAIFEKYQSQNLLQPNFQIAIQITNPEITSLTFLELENIINQSSKTFLGQN